MGDYVQTFKHLEGTPYEYTVTLTYGDFRNGIPVDLKSICYDYPAVEEIAATSEQTITDNQYGWNSSAHSVVSHAGDLYTQFDVPACIGVVCGLAPAHKGSDPRDVDHAFYCYKSAGKEVWVVQERGVAKTAPVVRDPDTDVFRIERRGSTVRYFFNGKTKYVSTLPRSGCQVVVACMYAAQDGVN